MAEITTATIMELRALTNAGMMDCKRALIEANGDMEEAIKQLRLKGQAIQVKRASKEANQGLVEAVSSEDGSVTALVEVNCETDFVAKTDKFKAFVKLVAERVLAGDDNEKVAESLKDELADLLATTGENVKIGRLARFAAEGTGKIGSYIHMGGKVGVVVEVGCGKAETLNCEAFTTLVHDLSLQIAAVSPRWLDDSQIPGDIITAERELYRQQMAEDKMPAIVID